MAGYLFNWFVFIIVPSSALYHDSPSFPISLGPFYCFWADCYIIENEDQIHLFVCLFLFFAILLVMMGLLELARTAWILAGVPLRNRDGLRSRFFWCDNLHGFGLAGFRYSWFRRRAWWNRTGWTGSDSSLRPDASASCRWTASLVSSTGSSTPEIFFWRSCRPAPALRMWNISWAAGVNKKQASGGKKKLHRK